MKLAEALQERADLNRRIQQLQQRLGNNAIVQENEKPIEDPKALLEELDRCIASLEDIITRINLTNCRTQVDGESLTALLARRAEAEAGGVPGSGLPGQPGGPAGQRPGDQAAQRGQCAPGTERG